MATRSEPPYLRIAADIRRRISSGELAAGDRVPSTRDLAQEWGVAMATAAHALGTLTREGVLRAKPRVGTLVAGERALAATTSERGGDLGRERIVAAAIAIADTEGLPALSLRGVAARLGVPVMSLYRHVANKDELLRGMVDAVLGEERLPRRPPSGWRAELELAARLQWKLLTKHPWVARLMSLSRPSPSANALSHADWVLAALDGHGLDPALRLRMHIILHAFIQGIAVNLETEAEAVGHSGMSDEDWMASQAGAFAAMANSGRYPAFAGVFHGLAGGFELDFEQLFEIGLAALLDGFARIIERSKQARRR